jgi:hypothetical protein
VHTYVFKQGVVTSERDAPWASRYFWIGSKASSDDSCDPPSEVVSQSDRRNKYDIPNGVPGILVWSMK